MTGTKAILDSNVIIDAARKDINIEKSILAFNHVYISLITYIEVMGYAFIDEQEKSLTSKILCMFEIVNPDIEIANLTIKYRTAKKIKIPDAIILATARKFDAVLITSNTKDFHNIDESVSIICPLKDK
jgi:predicted nucleic acid-binding protein